MICKKVYGMVHLNPLPGTPFFNSEQLLEENISRAVRSVTALNKAGAQGCLIQTVDSVYSKSCKSDPARIVALSKLTSAISNEVDSSFEIGVQVMQNNAEEALAISKFCGGKFIRCNSLHGSTFSNIGLISTDAYSFADYRNKIMAKDINVIVDIKTRHFDWYNTKRSVSSIAKLNIQSGASAVAIENSNIDLVESWCIDIREKFSEIPIVIAGNTNFSNIANLSQIADMFFVGKCIEKENWGGEVDLEKTKKYLELVFG